MCVFAAAGLFGATLCSHVGLKTCSRYTFSSRSLTLEQHFNVAVSDPTQKITRASFNLSPYPYRQAMDGENKQTSATSTSSWAQKIAEDVRVEA